MSVERFWPEDVYVRGVPSSSGKAYAQVTCAQGSKMVHVAGTLAFDRDSNPVGDGDMGAQVVCILDHIRASLEAAGAGPGDVVRTKTYVTDMAAYASEGYEHWRAFFGDALPASTTVAVAGLVPPHALVEIEAYAVVE
jgi:enamine deaminase RidA (YjgF/YER057c/UK114 family)